jgi:large subunit ribosomal protein L21
MNKNAVILTGGKQYYVKEKQVLVVDYLPGKEKEKLEFDKVLLTDDSKDLQLGHPFIEKAKVVAEILKQDRSAKIRVARFKAKSKYRKVRGHRTKLTQIRILSIS